MYTQVVFAALVATAMADFQCPGSTSFIHAKCQVSAVLAQNCTVVGAEIKARATGVHGWVDPHNAGTYELVSVTAALITVNHLTGAAPHYEDKTTLALSADGAGCKIDACSESQTFSIVDASTNYCNLYNLYCGSAEGCKSATGVDLTVSSEDKSSCSQSTASNCFIPPQ